jgi:hypothetical protein
MLRTTAVLVLALGLMACNFAINGVEVAGTPPADPSMPGVTPPLSDPVADAGTPPTDDAAPIAATPDLLAPASQDCRVTPCKTDEICCPHGGDDNSPQTFRCEKGGSGAQCGGN